MLKQIAAALFAATVIAAPAFAVDTGQSKPAVETSKPAADVKVQPPRHVRHPLRYHRHVTQAHVKHVKHAQDARAQKPGPSRNRARIQVIDGRVHRCNPLSGILGKPSPTPNPGVPRFGHSMIGPSRKHPTWTWERVVPSEARNRVRGP